MQEVLDSVQDLTGDIHEISAESFNVWLTKFQGWVDYKSFVVRYNYSYFKNM